MATLAELLVEIGVDERALHVGLNRVRSDLERFAARGVQVPFSLVGVSATGGLAAAAGAALFKMAKDAAYLGESVDKAKRTFKSGFGEIKGTVDELADSFGIVRKGAYDAAAIFGVLGQTAGMSALQSAGMAAELVKMAADLSAFYVIPRERVFEKLASGLEGQIRPLREVGIFLSADAVKAEALESGLIKVNRDLTEQEKILARLSLIRKQFAAGPAVGNLAATIQSPKMQLEKLQGDLVNAATAFGDKLLSSLQSGISLARELGAIIKEALGGPEEMGERVGERIKAQIDATRVIMKSTFGENINRHFAEDYAKDLKNQISILERGGQAGSERHKAIVAEYNRVAGGLATETAKKLGTAELPAVTPQELFKKQYDIFAKNVDTVLENIPKAIRQRIATGEPVIGGGLPSLFKAPPTALETARGGLSDIMADLTKGLNRLPEATEGLEDIPDRLLDIKDKIAESGEKVPPSFRAEMAEVGKLAGKIEQIGVERRHLEEDRIAREAKPKQSERFTEIADYASATIQGILDADKDKQEDRAQLRKIAEETEKARAATEKLIDKLAVAAGVRPR